MKAAKYDADGGEAEKEDLIKEAAKKELVKRRGGKDRGIETETGHERGAALPNPRKS